jgi:hypothetical protein
VKKKFRIKAIGRTTDLVIGYKDLEFDLPEADYRKPMFTKTLLDYRNALIDELIKMEVEDLTDK